MAAKHYTVRAFTKKSASKPSEVQHTRLKSTAMEAASRLNRKGEGRHVVITQNVERPVKTLAKSSARNASTVTKATKTTKTAPSTKSGKCATKPQSSSCKAMFAKMEARGTYQESKAR